MKFNQILAALALSASTLTAAALAEPTAPAMITPAENLVVEGVPPLPQSLAEQVSYYTEGRAAGFFGWHPKKREVLIATRFGDVPQIHQVASPGAARQQLTFYRQRISGASWRPKTADGFFFSKDIGGSEFFQLYWRDATTGKVTLATDGKSRNTGGAWAPNGKFLVYESTKRNGKDTDLYMMDPAQPSSNKMILQCEGGGWSGIAVSPDQKKVLLQEYISANSSHYWLADIATGTKTLITKDGDQKVAYDGGAFSHDGKSVFLTSDKDNEFQRLVSLDLSSDLNNPKWKVVYSAPWDISGFSFNENGTRIAMVINESGASKLKVLDYPSLKEVALPNIPPGVIGGVSFHPITGELAFSMSAAQSPSDIYSIDLSKKKIERWTQSETGGLDPKTFSSPQLVHWDSFDKKKISGFLYRPPAKFTGKRPVMIVIHGGPEGQSQPIYQGRNNYYLNELGIALFYPNVRGSTGFGKSYLAADNWEKREDSVKDIGALLDWISRDPNLDADRIVVMGGSYGGYMTLACMTNYNDRLRGGIDIVGISNFVTFLENTEGYRRDLRRVEYGDERIPEMRSFLQKISPLNNAQKITKPMFIIQGKNDPRVPVTEAEQMVKAIRANGGPAWYLMAIDEGHGFGRKANQDFQFYATIKFLQDHLLK
jgi:dipeptidyl aminopeptidase/acylaminoacyl peptidase